MLWLMPRSAGNGLTGAASLPSYSTPKGRRPLALSRRGSDAVHSSCSTRITAPSAPSDAGIHFACSPINPPGYETCRTSGMSGQHEPLAITYPLQLQAKQSLRILLCGNQHSGMQGVTDPRHSCFAFTLVCESE